MTYLKEGMSHPSRVRGLKQLIKLSLKARGVAPITGAWIETLAVVLALVAVLVAPITGAWIETHPHQHDALKLVSHPSRVRGLKQNEK